MRYEVIGGGTWESNGRLLAGQLVRKDFTTVIGGGWPHVRLGVC